MDKPVVQDPVVKPKERHAPLYRILIHNDPFTPMNFVVEVLIRVFALQYEKAVQIMLEAHKTEIALVTVEPLERAEFHVEQCKSLSGTRGFPLMFTYEPEN